MKPSNVGDWMTDPDKMANGVPYDMGRGRSLNVKRAGARNREFMAAVAGLPAPPAMLPNGDPVDPVAFAAYEREQMRVYASSVVVGWEGITDDQGNPLPFSADACCELFVACPELFAAVWIFAAQRGNYAAEEHASERDGVKAPSGG